MPTPVQRLKFMNPPKLAALGQAVAMVVFLVTLAPNLLGQSLGWEGETGVFVTPLAYTASDEKHAVEPVVAYHYFDAGPVIGGFYEMSVTLGAIKRVEFGFTRELHSEGSDATLSPLWHDGFNIFHGKVTLCPENFGHHSWVPAISGGFIARTQVHNVGGAFLDKDSNDADVYLVASKTITQTKPFAVVLSGGERGTNAQLWGMGGNAPDFSGRAFGAMALAFKGPAKSTIIVGSEAAQQPHHPDQFPTLNIPTTLTYCVRFVPSPKHKFNVDFGVAQIAGNVMPGVNLKARAQVGTQVSYGF